MRRQASSPGESRSRANRYAALVVLLLLLPVLAACGGDDPGNDISWQPGLPPATAPPSTGDSPTATTPSEENQPTETSESGESAQETATTAASGPPPGAGPTGRPLSDDELALYQPNELGKVMVLEYHQFTDDPEQVAQFTRTFDSFRADLQWLYDNGYYIVSMREVIENRITAPAGKKPVVLTFDDSPVNQFRFLIGDDGSLTVDPVTAVGIMQEFYSAHPDFGRGGLFGVVPTMCFNWSEVVAEPDQTEYCDEKITFLIDNGYEIGNHTLNHKMIYEVEDDVFLEEIGGAIDALRALDSRATADIFVVPNGMYPNLDTGQQQREWMRNGFEWNGNDYLLIGSLMVGSEPAFSPASSEWDSMWIYRIQMCDCEDVGGFGWDDYWQSVVSNDPGMIYVSDGDPNTITVPDDVYTGIFGDINEESISTREIVRY